MNHYTMTLRINVINQQCLMLQHYLFIQHLFIPKTVNILLQ